jgi:ABC-type dipeptide/oligopeptide/nickel transport system permease component
MLRVALRRTLWAIPTLVGISLVVFFVTTLIPDPATAVLSARADAASVDPALRDTLAARRRAHFLDMPRFVNAHPEDVRSRAEACVHQIAGDEAPAAGADDPARELVRLGGAALPFVLPELDKLKPGPRARVAIALGPIAERMGFTGVRLDDPAEATRFWERFWEDRSIDFTAPAVHRAVHRITQQETSLRAHDIVEVDTFALDELMAALDEATDRPTVMRISSLASHVAERQVVLPEDASDAAVRRVKGDWQEWWFVYREDFVPLEGGERVAARFADTRYGKWILRCARGRFGVSSRDGEPILDKLERRAPVTLALTGLSLLLSYALAIPLGVFLAVRRGHAVGIVLATAVFALYSLPTFWIAELLAHSIGPAVAHVPALIPAAPAHAATSKASFLLAVAALSAGSLAMLSRYERASLLEVLRQDYVRTARAKGVPALRVLVVHALRNALMPVVMLAGFQLPTSFGAAFVVEEVFKLPGMGYETLRAVEAHDAAWLTMVLLVLSVVAMIGLIVTDVAAGMLDPRVRDVMLARAGGKRS